MTSALLRSAPSSPDEALVHSIEPVDAGWANLSFIARRLESGAVIRIRADDRERLILVLEGRASVRVAGEQFDDVGSRSSVFDGPPCPVILAEPGAAVEVAAGEPSLVVIAAAPGGPIRRTAYVPPADILVERRGEGSTARRIHHLLPPSAAAGRLIAFEVFTPGGNWSSWPPHKHDTEEPPTESQLEELYYYRFARPQGFALQRVYTADRELDETLAPGDGDVVLVPRAYHAVGAAAGYDCYYLNVMAGPNRAWHFTVDPDHAWQMNWDPAPTNAAPTAAASK